MIEYDESRVAADNTEREPVLYDDFDQTGHLFTCSWRTRRTKGCGCSADLYALLTEQIGAERELLLALVECVIGTGRPLTRSELAAIIRVRRRAHQHVKLGPPL